MNGLLAGPEMELTSSPSQGLGRQPEVWEASQGPFSNRTRLGARARPFLSGRSPENIFLISDGVLLKPARPLRHL